MSNRGQRRASVSAFKKAAAGGYLDVHLLPADGAITNPLLERATTHWMAGVPVRRPVCASCKAKIGSGASVGSFICTIPSGAPTAASVSALCDGCWSRLSDDAVRAVALRLARKVLPGATFDAEPPR
jgi:hypothetical protein